MDSAVYTLWGLEGAYLAMLRRKQNGGLWQQARPAFFWYGAQLVVNDGLVTDFFLCFMLICWRFAWLGFAVVSCICNGLQFYKISPWLGKLIIPYLVWLTFAAYLNLHSLCRVCENSAYGKKFVLSYLKKNRHIRIIELKSLQGRDHEI